MERIKSVIAGVLATAFPLASIPISQRLHLVLQDVALAVGILGGVASTYWLYRINRVKVQREEAELCAQCRAGNPPPECPIPRRNRPDDCPHNL